MQRCGMLNALPRGDLSEDVGDLYREMMGQTQSHGDEADHRRWSQAGPD